MTAQSWSGLFDRDAGTTGGYVAIDNKSPIRSRARGLINREQFRVITALFNGLIGAASGGNVTATHKRVGANNALADAPNVNDDEIGGARTIETFTDINRNTVAADVTALKEITFGIKRTPTYGGDLSGNGGKAASL